MPGTLAIKGLGNLPGDIFEENHLLCIDAMGKEQMGKANKFPGPLYFLPAAGSRRPGLQK